MDLKPARTRSRVLLGLLYLGTAACVVAGSALVSSMGGELPSYDPTAGERSRWVWGNGLTLAGAALTVVCAALVVAFRKRLGLRLGGALGLLAAGILLTGLVWFFAWITFMA